MTEFICTMDINFPFFTLFCAHKQSYKTQYTIAISNNKVTGAVRANRTVMGPPTDKAGVIA